MARTLAPPLFSWFAAGWERDRRFRHRWVLCAALATSACTTWQQVPLPLADAACRAWSQALDAAVAQAGVTDAEADRIAGAPGLRVDRVGQALRALDPRNDDAYRAWLRRAAALDEAARTAEIANLPQTAFPLRSGETIAEDRQAARERTDDCRRRAVQQWAGAALPQREALLARAEVPDRYNPALRALGLYPLVRWPFLAGVQRWQDRHQAAMARWAESPPSSQSYAPGGAQAGSATPPPWPPPVDALGLPQPAPEVARQLLAWHAPVFRIQQRGTHDHFGVPQWTGSGQPRVDTDRPVVWHRLSHARLGGVWRLQLVYTLWFPERPADSPLDLLSGALDGVIVRLTLGADGQPELVDSIHSCGCYHLFFPSAALRPRAGGPSHQEWLFAPAALPTLSLAQRLEVRIGSASHDVLGLAAVPRGQGDPDARPYTLQSEDDLRMLPVAGGSRSLFGPDGLVPGTDRRERLLFWPMGIARAGAMRQWGHHATAFVGQRHFDDPELLEQRFERREVGPPRPP